MKKVCKKVKRVSCIDRAQPRF